MFTTLFMSFSSPAGWLLDISKLTLGENIGEGEFGGEYTFILSTLYLFISLPLCKSLRFLMKKSQKSYSMYTRESKRLS